MRKLTFAFFLSLLGLPVSAQEVDPKAVQAISLAEDGWDQAFELAKETDPVVATLLEWLQLREGASDFAQYQPFLTTHADWPTPSRLRTAGERKIDADTDLDAVLAYFADTAPQTGNGALYYAKALIAGEQTEQADAVLRDAWIGLRLEEDEQDALIDAFSEELKPFHTARVDALLWRARTSEAERMLSLLEPDQRALSRARIGYFRRASNLQALFNAVPEELRLDPGFVHARWTWLARRGVWDEAVEILLDRSTSAAALGEPERWADRRRVLARWAMREGQADEAYALASRHYLQAGSSYADLEWLAGYVALTYLGDPQTALGHFESSAGVVSAPISVGRMYYWVGRTQELLGNAELAQAAFATSAEQQVSFYGLLSAERLGRPLDQSLAASISEWPDDAVFENDLVKAALILLEAGERGHAVTFFAQIGRTLDAAQLAQLGAYLNELDEQFYTLILGKTSAFGGNLVPQIYLPLHDLAALDLPVDPALALSIARRESEFNVTIGSPAGALGLMQLMPATAEEVAGELGLEYSRQKLISDWEFNATLGAQYLATLQGEFGPTPVMIAAGYNAGPSRPNIWMDERGDPRLREMDVIDWIEHIPFRETRNYVMRVTESIPLYRARLTGQAGPVAFTDILIGQKPLLRPIARPVPAPEPDVRPIARSDREEG